MMRSLTLLSLGLSLFCFQSVFAAKGSAPAARSDDWSAVECDSTSRIVVDCGKHEISISSPSSPRALRSAINCGKPGLTKNGRGTIGERFSPSNYTAVGEAVDIRGITGMGSPPFGTGEVFHATPPFNQNNHPSRSNSSHGCIHVEKDVLLALTRCQGASIEITNAQDGGSNAAPYQTPPTWGEGMDTTR